MVILARIVNILRMSLFPLTPRRRRWTGVALGTLGVFLVAWAIAVPIVRSRAEAEAARRHLKIEIGTVVPGFFSVGLRNVRVAPESMPEVAVAFERVVIDVGITFAPSEVSLLGGDIAVSGTENELRDKWLGAKKDDAETSADAKKLRLRGERIRVQWNRTAGERLTIDDLSFERAEETSLLAGLFKFEHGALTVSGKDARATLVGKSVLRSLDVREITVGLVAPEKATIAAVAPDEPPPTVAPTGELFSVPDPKQIFEHTRLLPVLVASRLSDSAEVSIRSLYFTADMAGDKVAIGPGHLDATRALDKVHVAFATEKGDGVTPLSLVADFPAAVGDATIVLDGGPVPLSLLGLKDGMAGLTDVNKGSVRGRGKISASPEATTFDVSFDLHGVSIKQPRLANDTLRGIDLSVTARGALTAPRKLRIDDADVQIGEMKIGARGVIASAPDHGEASISFDVNRTPCQSILESVPQALLPIVHHSKMTGVFSASGRLAFNTRSPDDLIFDTKIDDECKMTAVPEELAHERFSKPFSHRIVHPDGSLGEETTGPTSDNWTPIGAISPFMQVAVLTTEDGAFFRHKGFNHAAIRSSLAANLKARKFVRGASTISMQLAKNLFLAREKTLSRKLEEIVLTDYLEQVWGKEEIMELYLNVIEFGPDLYGITAAADHYFGRRADELNLAESLFLATLLPSPVRYHRMWEKGELPDYWAKNIRNLMTIAQKNGKITSADLAEGLKQSITFFKGGPRPDPRPPVLDRRIPQDEMDVWQPLP